MAQKPQKFDAQLADLLDKLSKLSPEQQAKLRPLVEETRARQAALEADVAQAHAALDDWRITMKYAVFAEEAARREKKQ